MRKIAPTRDKPRSAKAFFFVVAAAFGVAAAMVLYMSSQQVPAITGAQGVAASDVEVSTP